MKKIEEQLDAIEEVLSVVVRKTSGVEDLMQSSTEAQNALVATTLAEIKAQLKQIPSAQLLTAQFSGIQKAVESIPRKLEIRNHHHFDLRSKGFIISAAAFLIVTALSVAVAISSYRESSRLRESDLKFRIARQLSPALTAKADSIYYRDPNRAEFETQRLEAHELSVKQAEALLKQKQKEINDAQKVLKKLKKE